MFYDVRNEPFRVFGLYNYKSEPEFKRMPDEAARGVSYAVERLARNTAGGRVRFMTNSKAVAIRAVMPTVTRMSEMPLSASAGFDLFVEEPTMRIYRHAKTLIPPQDAEDGYVSRFEFPDSKPRYITIHFPLYCDVTSLEIGLNKNSELSEGLDYRSELPIVYYGSSITQGGCASRPGNAYENIVSRSLELDHINLGFSGSARGEDAIINYIKTLKMYAFISDYDHNSSVDGLKRTHKKLYEAVRETNPDIPYIIISKPDFDQTYEKPLSNYNEAIERRNVIFDTYRYARSIGDKNVFFIDGESIFRGNEDMATVDTVHPGDLGFKLMADAVAATIKKAITQHLISV